MNSIFIIAEAGVNHNGNPDMAFRLVDTAVSAGANAVKFQTFKAENLVTRNIAKANYQKQATGAEESQFSMLKRLELSRETHHRLADYCRKKNIELLSTAFDTESLFFLVRELGLKTLKIPSGEITNAPLLLEHARTGCHLIMSTGMAMLGEIEEALGVLAYGLNGGQEPSRELFQQAYCSEAGQAALKEKVTLLHCTTEYPAPYQDINLKVIPLMHQIFGLNTGYSDHSLGITVPVAAVVMGATLVEKHFTLDKKLPGPDHQASLDPEELHAMVEAIRVAEQVTGTGLKAPTPSEIKNRNVVRKSIVAAQNIAKGEVFSEQNLAIKRAGTGTSPMNYWDLLGTKSKYPYEADEAIRWPE